MRSRLWILLACASLAPLEARAQDPTSVKGVEAEDRHPVSFGLERTVGGHAFQLSVSNSFGTTLSQMARGGPDSGFYVGFNIARKFY